MSTTISDSSTAASQADLSGFDQLKEKSLKAAGWAYIVGDAALVAAGLMEKEPHTAIAGMLYGTGGVVLARYGNPHAEKRLQLLYQDLGKYLKAQGIDIPKGSKVDRALLTQDNGIIDHIERFLYKHPSQVLNALFAVGGGQLLHGGIKQNRPWKTASGALVTAGALAGLLIPEKHIDARDEHPGGFFDKAWRWMQDKPLRTSGYLYMANNVTLTTDAFLHRKQKTGDHSHILQLLTVASYMVANGLLATSLKKNTASKDEQKEKTSMEELEQAAAEVIAAQPQELQQKLTQGVAGYLSAQGRTNIPAEELAAAMQNVINEHRQYAHNASSWAERTAQTTGTPTPTL